MDLRGLAREEVHARRKEGATAVSEQVLEEKVRKQLGAGYWERTSPRRGWRNGYASLDLITRWAGGGRYGCPGIGKARS